ncbi:hypothetical protein RCC89_02535 [Cytophagaceae bacterium ABcell3]|nr:hypothetical protein RCC89_02535 [Cytophagaceae bacterium ABcell3]
MKKYILLATLLLMGAEQASAQCEAEDCIAELSDGYTFLKTHKIESTESVLEYSYVLSKNTNYMIKVCNNEGAQQRITITLLDSNRKEVATNYDKKNDTFNPAIFYDCKATGVYYIKYAYENLENCSLSVLAFKK